ncbi:MULTISPECIES: hypothetical protein [unclassified Rhizobium]|uniref:hypothetical protein n=1 Tax=unclassified Rhizobium TaxID=2613769 RepID=UPI001049DBBC|nr:MULTISPECIES: hypothetical protein [unclassified Rhizobium]MBB3394463.1 hypothetical protein [Rhizobium sp. BK060]MBB4169497.1 hypothetical protein [Rhizobium sp. BK538]
MTQVADKGLRTSITKRNVSRDALAEAWNKFSFDSEIRVVMREFVDTYENFYGISEALYQGWANG